MIKLMEVNSTPQLEKIIVAYADASEKSNITTKAATTISGVDFDYVEGSLIYCSDFDVAILDSDGNWNWKG